MEIVWAQYWVSQGNKWCEFCRIFIANNAVSIRSHELGLRHKDNVAKKVSKIHKDSINKEKEELRSIKELEHIESKAVRKYQNDIADGNSSLATPTLTASKIYECTTSGSQHTYSGKSTVAQRSQIEEAKQEWFSDSATGYQFNPATGHYFDPKSGFYYSDVLGQWTTEAEALKAARLSKSSGATVSKKNLPPVPGKLGSSKPQPAADVKGRPSAFAVTAAAANNNNNKRKRDNRKQNSTEEARAQAEREAARKRVQEREKSSLGLYQAY
ncbi:hypothetical protein SELMODRAFT_440013 [Selaginella moellendorffii]|uniref:Matrin-type domain-containing protein n=1 Tax=Selaginella moellendorffii TaxID=88036 RepID=D8R8V7_SELML|nr:hypothetical protein SELMODRAFT_440013 [Selaginella moellendorffii]